MPQTQPANAAAAAANAASPQQTQTAPLSAGQLVLLGVPPALLALWMALFCRWNVVWGDGISQCWIFEKYYRSELTFHDLWQSYQGHRILFQRALSLAIGSGTHWNVSYEIGLIYGLTLLNFFLLYRMLRGLRGVLSPRAWLLLAGVVSFSVFSAAQVGNWSNNFQLNAILSVTGVVSGIACLAGFGATYPALGAAVLAGVVASYSFGNGFVYWVACVPLLAAKLRADPAKLPKAALWFAAAALVVFLYFFRFEGSGARLSTKDAILDALIHPLHFAAYLLTYCGAAVFYLNGAKAAFLPGAGRVALSCIAPFWGLLGLLSFGGLALWSLRFPARARFSLLAPWWSLGLYALFTALITTLARFSGNPLESAIASRYVSFSQFLWLAVFVVGAVIVRQEGFPVLPPSARRLLTIAAAALFLSGMVSYANGLRWFRTYSHQLQQIRADLRGGGVTDATLTAINAEVAPEKVARSVEVLRTYQLATFYPPVSPPPKAAAAAATTTTATTTDSGAASR